MWEEFGPALLPAFWMTIKLTFLSAIGSLIWGTILTAFRVSPVPILRGFGTAYVNIVRNTPLTLVVLFCSMGLYQNLGLALAPENDNFVDNNNFNLAVLAFILYTSTFVCETLRAGINTVPLGQAEAARSLGMGFGQILGIIILPQAFRSVINPLGSVLIALIKNTTIASVIGVAEASLLMKSTVESYADELFVIFGVIALGFIIITLPVGLITGKLGEKMAVKR
ncbi:amino acid ABC transporter permease [Dietzia sp.]|uniref:amino acid ABC transporter permease n=1 Tax=Dietzia sp. TaxID=1871616 RepID=UPI002FDA6379